MYPEKHTYYYTCPYCGSNNDPGETCDCQKHDPPTNVTEKSDTNKEKNDDKRKNRRIEKL